MLSVDEPRRVVRCYDPAIDQHKTPVRQYIMRREFADVVFRDGVLPVIFHVRLLDDDALRAVARCADDESRAVRAFEYACIRVENRPTRGNSARATWVNDKPLIGGAQAPMHSDDAKSFAWVDRIEIGRVALELSTLPFDLGFAAPCQLLPTSVRIWGQTLDLLAAELSASATEKSTAKPPASPPEAPSTPPESAPPTDATAAADAT